MSKSSAAVIAVAAPPGGGKTTLVRLLAARLGGAPTLHYDDYEQITRRSPAEIEAWLERGAPADEVPLPGFADAMLARKQGGARYVILDFLLARAHQATARHIDMAIWIDTPLDIALARTLRQQVTMAGKAAPAEAATFVAWLAGYLDSYGRVMHRGYQLQLAAVRPHADLVLDGMLPPEALVERALAEIVRRFP
jgi:uridine kinase